MSGLKLAFSESFGSLAPYATISGNRALFTIADNALSIAPQNTGTPAIIRRELSTVYRGVKRITFVTRITAANSDDSGILTFTDAAGVYFSFIARREGSAIPYLSQLTPGLTPLTATAALTVGVDYRVAINFYDGITAASCAITNLVSGVTTTTSLSNDFVPIDVATLGFTSDSGGLTSGVEYSNILAFNSTVDGTSVRFPAGLPLPLRDGYTSNPEKSRIAMEMESGPARRRQRVRSTPQLMDVYWELTLAEWSVFDKWFQGDIRGGELEFDIELLDSDNVVKWFTCRFIGEFKAEIIGQYSDNWKIVAQLRTSKPPFTVRPGGTDELRGFSNPGIFNTGQLLISKTLRGLSTPGVVNTARFGQPAMRGLSTPTVVNRGRLAPYRLYGLNSPTVVSTGFLSVTLAYVYYPELSRQWMNLDWLGTLSAEDISTVPEVVQREFMEI